MRLYPSKVDCCPSDKTYETSMITMPRGHPEQVKRAKQIHHVKNGVRFWHWSDQTDLKQAEFLPVEESG